MHLWKGLVRQCARRNVTETWFAPLTSYVPRSLNPIQPPADFATYPRDLFPWQYNFDSLKPGFATTYPDTNLIEYDIKQTKPKGSTVA